MNRFARILTAIVSLVAAVALGGCDSMPGRPREADLPLRPSAVSDFAQLYRENCAGCHGIDGKFGAAISLNNPVYLLIVDDNSLRRVIAHGVPRTAMPPFASSAGGSLTDRQIDILIAGIRKWSSAKEAVPGAPPYSSSVAGDPSRGAKTYATYCQSCHGPGGRGVVSIVDSSYLSLVSDQYLRTVVICGRAELGHPAWNDYLPAKLTAEQVSDVVAWLAAKRSHPVTFAQAH